jgi:hypothetical protein
MGIPFMFKTLKGGVMVRLRQLSHHKCVVLIALLVVSCSKGDSWLADKISETGRVHLSLEMHGFGPQGFQMVMRPLFEGDKSAYYLWFNAKTKVINQLPAGISKMKVPTVGRYTPNIVLAPGATYKIEGDVVDTQKLSKMLLDKYKTKEGIHSAMMRVNMRDMLMQKSGKQDDELREEIAKINAYLMIDEVPQKMGDKPVKLLRVTRLEFIKENPKHRN